MKTRIIPRSQLPFALSLFTILIIFSTSPALAQQRTDARNPQPSKDPKSAQSQTSAPLDIEFTATVTARELTFEAVPNVKVEFPGTKQRETVWDAERDNLPRPVQPGVTYRDIGIRLKITSLFADIDRIVSEALGETPVREGEQQPSKSAQPPPKPETRKPDGGTNR